MSERKRWIKPEYESKRNKIKELYPELMDLYTKGVINKHKVKEYFNSLRREVETDTKNIKPTRGIAVDGWCRNNPGKGGYKGVDIETGKTLFAMTFPLCTNNIAEFCAIGHALMYCKKEMTTHIIYSDSNTAIGWINNKKSNTSFRGSEISDNYIQRIEYWLIEQKHLSEIRKWNTKEWGEIPADFGNK